MYTFLVLMLSIIGCLGNDVDYGDSFTLYPGGNFFQEFTMKDMEWIKYEVTVYETTGRVNVLLIPSSELEDCMTGTSCNAYAAFSFLDVNHASVDEGYVSLEEKQNALFIESRSTTDITIEYRFRAKEEAPLWQEYPPYVIVAVALVIAFVGFITIGICAARLYSKREKAVVIS